jgi:hypothetical protein
MYVIDTSAILHAWRRDYPPDTFPSLWANLEEAIQRGELRSPDEVLLELERGGDDVHEWARQQPDFFVEPDDRIQVVVGVIVDQWPEFVPDESHDGVWADPYIVALASVSDAIVITGEVLAADNARRPKIPNVCRELGVNCSSVLGMLRTEKWVF